jgi:hypothetical protein
VVHVTRAGARSSTKRWGCSDLSPDGDGVYFQDSNVIHILWGRDKLAEHSIVDYGGE